MDRNFEDIVKNHLNYNPDTGILSWINPYTNRFKHGAEVGYTGKDGYRRIQILGKVYLVHRVIWFIVYGNWPKNELDHIDLNRSNNKIENLRECTHSLNNANRISYKNSISKYKGVNLDKRDGVWSAEIHKDNIKYYLGRFKCETSAALAYDKKAKEFFGEYARLNFG